MGVSTNLVRLMHTFKRKSLLLLLMVVISFTQLLAQEETTLHLEELPLHSKMFYYFRLKNGDILSGRIYDYIVDKENGPGIVVQTEIGKATLYEYQISEIKPLGSLNKHTHRSSLLPTAEPIGDNHYFGLYELIVPAVGFGITDYFSFIAARSIIPGIFPNEQISLLNGKVTILNEKMTSIKDNTVSMAFGWNSLWLNTINNINHAYFVTTYESYSLRASALLMLKIGGPDSYVATFSPYAAFNVFAQRNSAGAGFTTDIKFNDTHDLYAFGEVWMNSFQGGNSTNILAGIRMADTRISADIGFLFTTAPGLVPIAIFSWTPF